MSPKGIPHHVSLTVDGNRRYAAKYGLSVQEGHLMGARKLSFLATYLFRQGVDIVSVYCLSTENIKERTRREIRDIETLLCNFCNHLIVQRPDILERDKFKVRRCGNPYLIRPHTLNCLTDLEERTKDYKMHELNLCIAYGGQDEILMAICKIAKDICDRSYINGEFNRALYNDNLNSITEEDFGRYLYISDDVDLSIRPGKVRRLSGLLIWQSAYAEYEFPDKYFPELTRRDIDLALERYAKVKRTKGGGKAERAISPERMLIRDTGAGAIKVLNRLAGDLISHDTLRRIKEHFMDLDRFSDM